MRVAGLPMRFGCLVDPLLVGEVLRRSYARLVRLSLIEWRQTSPSWKPHLSALKRSLFLIRCCFDLLNAGVLCAVLVYVEQEVAVTSYELLNRHAFQLGVSLENVLHRVAGREVVAALEFVLWVRHSADALF